MANGCDAPASDVAGAVVAGRWESGGDGVGGK